VRVAGAKPGKLQGHVEQLGALRNHIEEPQLSSTTEYLRTMLIEDSMGRPKVLEPGLAEL